MSDVPNGRRRLLAACAVAVGALAVGDALAPALARAAEPDPEIPNDEVARIMRERFGGRPIVRGKLDLDMPAVAEDGRIVPVIIESHELPMTADRYVRAIYLIVDHNPDPLVAAYHLSPAIGRVEITTRIKMKRTTWVRAIAELNTGELWADYAKVSVSLNGCG